MPPFWERVTMLFYYLSLSVNLTSHKADRCGSMIADLQESNWNNIFLANKNADVCALWNIFKAKIYQLRKRFVPTSSNETPFSK